ncbi:MobQ family relaxase [Aeribacillus pallidus]|uniref:MobQ family relaxase n=1 Tax=Aeribacillus composti TaxID=1868734 RepID=UPI002E24AF83|nr:MobQ family relaxase [Aeribacillus composti]MED4487237.1 MobQ family relaxase [Aeribacillus pallidus]
MAYFMFRTQVISKSNRSAVACAAYRSGQALYSERDGLTKKYGHREVKPETYILAPKHAPEWVYNRERLWNEVEKVEKQHNAQLAREIIVALPVQFTNEEQTQLVLDFCKENFADEGMVADVSIHRDKKHNPHAHIMLTMRPFNEDGTWGKKRKKIDGKSVHLTNWNEKETLLKWRKNFADKINEKFKEKGLEDRVSHESYEKQGIDKVPKIRLSREAYQYEQRMKKEAEKQKKPYEPVTYYGKLNEEIQEINKELNALKQREKVVSISNYQNEKSLNKTIESIRKNASLNDVEKASLLLVAKRAKSYVDFAVARRVYLDIVEGNWKKKIDSQQLKIRALKNVINKAYHVYQQEPKQVVQYGFHPQKFKEQLKEKIAELKSMESAFENDRMKHEAVLKKAEVALEVQKQFTREEFEVLYPHVDVDKFGIEEQYHAVQHFKETGKILSESDITNYAAKKEQEIHPIPTFVEQTRNISKSLFILNRAIQKQSKERIEALKIRDFDKVHEASRKIEQYVLKQDKMNKELEENKTVLKVRLQEHYGVELSITNTEVLLRLQELVEKGESRNNLTEDLQKIQKNAQLEQNVSAQNQETAEQILEQQYAKDVADGLFRALEEIQRANEHKKYEKDPTRKRQRKRYRGQDLER